MHFFFFFPSRINQSSSATVGAKLEANTSHFSTLGYSTEERKRQHLNSTHSDKCFKRCCKATIFGTEALSVLFQKRQAESFVYRSRGVTVVSCVCLPTARRGPSHGRLFVTLYTCPHILFFPSAISSLRHVLLPLMFSPATPSSYPSIWPDHVIMTPPPPRFRPLPRAILASLSPSLTPSLSLGSAGNLLPGAERSGAS